jgi:CHAT domain-containing protein
LIDCPATASFAIELMKGLRSGSDPAVVLHEAQLRWLEQWETTDGTPMSGAEGERHPIFWAGWTVTGKVWRLT